MRVVAKEHGVVARGHRAAAAPFRQVVAQLFTGPQIKRPLVGVISIADHHRVLQVTAVVPFAFLVVILPEKASCRDVNRAAILGLARLFFRSNSIGVIMFILVSPRGNKRTVGINQIRHVLQF